MTKPASPTPMIEIFRAGRQVDMHGREMAFTRDDLVNLASSYDPATSEAPIVVGHPKTNDPAYGWVRGLRVDGDVLSAELDQVDPAFADMVRAGRFKKRSASFFLPEGKDNPTPGKLYLRHVGFLGAAAPAVKGLKEVSFAADDEGCAEFALSDRRWGFSDAAGMFRRLRDYLIETVGLEKADNVLPDWQINSLKEAAEPDAVAASAVYASPGSDDNDHQEDDVSQKSADFAAREEKINADKAALDARDKALADREAKAQREDAAEFADGLIAAGKLLPKDKATVVELLLALPTATPLSFASGDVTIEKPAAQLLRELLESTPKHIDFSEKSGADDADVGAASFTAPVGAHVDSGQLELHRKAKAYQAQHPNTSFLAAVKAVGG